MSRIRTVDFDRLATSAPLNRQAAQDYNATGEGWTPEKDSGNRRWDTPPPMRTVPRHVPDLTGLVTERLAVIGLYDAPGPHHGKGQHVRWVCRCVCGAFETRKARVLIDETNRARRMCSRCDYLEELKAGHVPTLTVAERLAAKGSAA